MNRAERRAAGHRGPASLSQPIKPQRVVYGAGCSWWDTIDKAVKTTSGLPGCPHCKSVLFEVESEAVWWQQVDHHAVQSEEPGYRELIEWMRGKCFPDFRTARVEFEASRS